LRPAGASRLEVLSSIVCIPLNFPLLGRLSIWFEPNPVPFYTGDNPCYSGVNEWQYTAYLEEQGGVGVTIERFTWDFYDQNGQYLGQSESTSEDFAQWFKDCGEGSTYIPAKATVCGKLCAQLGQRPSGSVAMTFYGTDDHGKKVSEGARVYFSPAVTGTSPE